MHDINASINMLDRYGNITLLRAPEKPLAVSAFALLFGRRSLSNSLIGGIYETQEMFDFCGEHNITADVEVISIQMVNEAYKRMVTAACSNCPRRGASVGTVGALLMGPDGGFITGSDFLMDGGVTASYWYGELAPK